MINVLMIDEVSSIKAVKTYLSSKSSTNVNIKYSCSDGLEAVNLIKEEKDNIDCIIMGMILPSLDGMGILKFLKNENIDKKVIIYTYNNNLSLLQTLNSYNVVFYLFKNVDLSILEERVNDACAISMNNDFNLSVSKSSKKTKEISKLLHELGMPSHIKGYQYIRDSIEMMYKNPSTFGGITKEVYPYIADKYNTTPSRVERAIRHAIEVSWTRGDYDLMEEIFGHSVDFDRAKPTNSEFLATLADKLCIDNHVNV